MTPWRNVREFGAAGDGRSLDSPAINRAVAAVAEQGGGTVFVPAGAYRCGTIRLASRVRLYLDFGAVLRASEDLDDYERIEGVPNRRALVAAKDCQHLSIEGAGVIDGRGESFMDWSRNSPPEPNAPRFTEGSDEGPVLPKERPEHMICFHGCRGVRLDGVRLHDSPAWCLTAMHCEDVTLTRLEIVRL